MKMEMETILVVDHDPAMRAEIDETLSEAGFAVIEAGCERELLSCLIEHEPDLLLLNIRMPDMDSYGFCRSLRSSNGKRELPVVIVTDIDDVESVEHGYDSGVTDFIIKPFNWPVAIHRLQYILQASRAMQQARTNEKLLAEAQRIARLGNWSWDTVEEEMFVSDQTCRIFGVPKTSPCVFHQLFINSVHPEDRTAFEAAMDSAREGRSADVEFHIRPPDGVERTVLVHAECDGKPGSGKLFGTIQDITERRRTEQSIRQLAYYDPVTRLPNRTLFKEHLSTALHQAKRHNRQVAVMFLDLDNFKRINDSLGHSAGDQLLQEVSRRLKKSIRASDMASRDSVMGAESSLARLGGDEFTVMLSDVRDADHVAQVADRILQSMNEPFILAGNRVVVTSSIGVSVYPDDGDEVDALLRHADAAMYQVKYKGRNGVFFYDDELRQKSQDRIQLEGELYKALQQDQLTLFYQPKMDARNKHIAGFEALIRWIHPDRGMVSPMEFISVAEDSGLIIPMGKWVIKTACKQHQAWRKAGLGKINISVNLSCHQFSDQQLLSAVRDILDETGMDPKYLEFEITESVLMQDADLAMRILGKMKEMGLKLSVDDFGTGYSSMAYLKHFPLDVIKIDRSFVMDIPENEQDITITTAIIRLAQALELGVVAEGVETEEQMQFLQELDCDQLQGYLFSPPGPAEKMEQLLK